MKTGRSRIRRTALATGAALVASLMLSGGGPPGGDGGTAPAPETTSSAGTATKNGDSAARKPPLKGGRTIRVQANLRVGEELDLGAPGRSAGDQFVFSGDLLARSSERRVGRFGGFCVIHDVERNGGECSMTAVLRGGQIAAQGEQTGIPTPRPVTNALTGGTGEFRRAQGQVSLRVLTPATWELTFHVTSR